ncbi:hypothetical protein FRB93_000529 [Tulasnella sp. JGI-2019a]|nr:hypothetical protein FRB93_000529 [Tulasnella sp. JGI-2019a]
MSIDRRAETVTCAISIQRPYTESSLKAELERVVGGFLENFTQLLSKTLSEFIQFSLQTDRNIAIVKNAVNRLDLQLKKLITSYCRRQNQEVMINQLPVEVLARIFFHSLQGSYATQFNQLHNLAQVSVRWSQLVKGTPELFGFVTTDSTEEQARCMLRLSRDAPLDIHYRWHRFGSWRAELLDTLLSQANRWRSIEMSDAPLMVVNRTFQRATPMLHDIHFADIGGVEGISLNPETLGRLHHLTLERVAIPWDPGNLRDLKSLELYSIRVEGRPSLPRLLRILQASQGIQVLRLRIESVADTPMGEDYTPIELSQLNILALTDLSHDTAHDLLKSIRIPRCKIFIVKRSFTPTFIPTTAVLFNSASHMAPTLRSILQTISSISISLDPATMSIHGKGEGVELELDLPMIPFSGSILWFEPMINLVPDSATVSLMVTGTPQSGEHFPTLHHPSISTIHILDNHMEAYRWILLLSAPSATGEWFLPRLKDLKFHNCSIDPSDIIAMAWCRYGKEMGDEKEEQIPSEKVGKMIGGNGEVKECDDQKLQLPAPLRCLEISGFNRLFTPDFAELEGIVGYGNVIWDNDGP